MPDPTELSRKQTPPSARAQTPDKRTPGKGIMMFVFFIVVLVLYLGLCQLSVLIGSIGNNQNLILGVLAIIIGLISLGCTYGVFWLFNEFFETVTPLFLSKIPTLLLIVFSAIIAILLLAYSFQTDQSEKAKYAPVADPTVTVTDPDPSAVVTCDNKPMPPTQVCDHIFILNGSRSTTTYTYEEQRKYQSDDRIEKARSALLQKNHQQQSQEQSKHGVLNSPLGWIATFTGVGFVFLVIAGFAILRVGGVE